jgi:hypothetical protein
MTSEEPLTPLLIQPLCRDFQRIRARQRDILDIVYIAYDPVAYVQQHEVSSALKSIPIASHWRLSGLGAY